MFIKVEEYIEYGGPNIQKLVINVKHIINIDYTKK